MVNIFFSSLEYETKIQVRVERVRISNGDSYQITIFYVELSRKIGVPGISTSRLTVIVSIKCSESGFSVEACFAGDRCICDGTNILYDINVSVCLGLAYLSSSHTRDP